MIFDLIDDFSCGLHLRAASVVACIFPVVQISDVVVQDFTTMMCCFLISGGPLWLTTGGRSIIHVAKRMVATGVSRIVELLALLQL